MGSAPQRHVLLVEEDEEFRTGVQGMLAEAGFRVTAAVDFFAAIKVIEAGERIDLLLTGLRMTAGTPNGMAISRMVRLRRRQLPTLYMTGFYEPTVLSALDPGVPILTKPFTARELVAAITVACHRHEDNSAS